MNKYTKMLRKYREQQNLYKLRKRQDEKMVELWKEKLNFAEEILQFYIKGLKETLDEHGFVKSNESPNAVFYKSQHTGLEIKIPIHISTTVALHDLEETMNQLSAYFGEKDA